MRVRVRSGAAAAAAHRAAHVATKKAPSRRLAAEIEKPKRSGPSLTAAPARHVPIPARQANVLGNAVEVIDRDDPKALTQALMKAGYTEGVAQRIVARAPEIAAKILSSPTPGPLTLPSLVASAQATGLVYRGVHAHPYDYDPRYVGEAFGKTQWVGDMITAEGYARDGSLADKPPAEGRTKNLTTIVELQLPEALVHERVDHHANFSRDQIPDETLFINRVGVMDWSDVERQWVPGTMDDYIAVPKLKWYPYDEVFDEKGRARRRPDF